MVGWYGTVSGHVHPAIIIRLVPILQLSELGGGWCMMKLEVFSEDISRAGSTIYLIYFCLYFRLTTSQSLVGS